VAKERDIKNRIKSISNTKKITSTMEMVSTAKMKKMQGRLEMSKPYEEKINHVINNLMTTGVINTVYNPLFKEMPNPTRILILQITGNRGLCGSFNANIINNTLSFRDKLAEEGKSVTIYNIGKKGQNFLNFIKEPYLKSNPNPEDKMTFEDASRLAKELEGLFVSAEFHEVYISYMKVISSVSQKPEILKFLPITKFKPEDELDPKMRVNTIYIFEPDPMSIFSYILPLFLKITMLTSFLESSFSEQFARRVAMKNATDASGDMIRELTISYNRARQAKITKEISEIIGGAAALK